MKLEVNIEKKYAYGILGLLLVLIGVVGVFATLENGVTHSVNDLTDFESSVQTIVQSEVDNQISSLSLSGEHSLVCEEIMSETKVFQWVDRPNIPLPSYCIDYPGCIFKIQAFDDSGVNFNKQFSFILYSDKHSDDDKWEVISAENGISNGAIPGNIYSSPDNYPFGLGIGKEGENFELGFSEDDYGNAYRLFACKKVIN